MFEKIKFLSTEIKKPITTKIPSAPSSAATSEDEENQAESDFYIWGSIDAFIKPPVTSYVAEHLNYVQDFCIFHYKKGSYTRRQNYPYFLVLYTYSGTGTVRYRGKTYHLSQGDGCFIDCREAHSYEASGSHWDTAVLHLDGPLLPAIHPQFLYHNIASFHEPPSGQFQHFLEQLLLMYITPHLHRDWQTSNCISNLLTYLLDLSAAAKDSDQEIPQNIKYLIKYLESNYTSKLTLDSLSEFANMNKYHLAKEFKRYTGFSPNDYLISLRINQAKLLLKTTSSPASKIAHQIGIHDINNFTNLFKKRVGMTPIQYRSSSDLFPS